MITGPQIRAARAFLGWAVKDLADRAKVGISTIQRIENAVGPPNTLVSNLAAIQAALEAAGIEFINGDAPGVRMRGKALK